ncbi:MerR family transcriptional regulator [Brachybacterium alimentarium]|uniref:MerR family transcriptional regulator n=1 Tax=Brachybacterium alimentarium TaxID=47845 RepID=UPI003FD0DE82
MRISALAERTGVAVGTIKFYLREGLVPPGRQTSRTTAEYDETHVERIRLVRALTDTGGLEIADVRRVVAVIDAPDPGRLDVLAIAQDALTASDGREERTGAATGGGVRDWVRARGWPAEPGDRVVQRLEKAWDACEDAGIHVDDTMMDAYADAVEEVARVDVAAVPAETEDAVRRVVVGTVMMEPVLSALRLLAQRQVSVEAYGRR